MMLYICTKFCKNIPKGFRVTDLNIRVDTRVVANVDARTDARTDGKPDPYMAPCRSHAQEKAIKT